MGVPWATIKATMRLRIWRSRRHTTSPSSHSPSAPQFQEKLSLLPAAQSGDCSCDPLSQEQVKPLRGAETILCREELSLLPAAQSCGCSCC